MSRFCAVGDGPGRRAMGGWRTTGEEWVKSVMVVGDSRRWWRRVRKAWARGAAGILMKEEGATSAEGEGG